ncbi:N-formylglutamate amidohydrolase [Sandarakinorhabdus sp.]|uniref:N-formylglutamate amidohydrolase n=1 Tax=Sandarakinorhabdus sp. TaxID=1916663 RepID=UPI00286E9C36|nr:N-formylglutamate amidohydrolase [Sandarakinorhabdus sp.]
MTMPVVLDGTADMLMIADHASNFVPAGVMLGLPPAMLEDHIAVDIGTDPLTRALAALLSAPAIIASVSRLVIDLNREPENAIPAASDGHVIPGNWNLPEAERALRLTAIHQPYHVRVAAEIAGRRPIMLVSIHSFTPQLATRPDEPRPWPVGVLYNTDDRAALPGIAALAAYGLHVGDNQPYSGRDLNYTMNRHAEGAGIPYLGIEVRNDGLRDAAGIAHWAHVLAGVIAAVRRQLGPV